MSERIAVITGSSRGIGKAILAELAAAGYIVIGTATSEKGVDSINSNITSLGAKGAACVLDISDSSSVDAFYVWLKENWGAASILVNNAGITRDNIALRMKPDQWDEVINTNLNGTFRMCKAALKGMFKARFGRIINIASVSGVSGNVGQSNYAAAKGGTIAMTKSMALEMANYGVTANCVAPGFTETDMVESMEEKQKQLIEQLVPMRRMAKPEEIAYAVSFLASERSAYITGETIQVNGGLVMQ